MKTIQKEYLSKISGGVDKKEATKQAAVAGVVTGAAVKGYQHFSLGGPQHTVSKIVGGSIGAASATLTRNKVVGGYVSGASTALMDNKINTPRPADIRKVSTSEWCQIHADRMQ